MPPNKIHIQFVADILLARRNPRNAFDQQKVYDSVRCLKKTEFISIRTFKNCYFLCSELYYKNVIVTQKQENVNEALKTICCLLNTTPWELGVLSTSKGLIAGPLQIYLPDNVMIDCNIDKNGINELNSMIFFLHLF